MSNSMATRENSKGNTSSRRSKKSQEVNLNNTVTVDRPAIQEELKLSTDQDSQVIAMPQLKLQDTPKQEASQISTATPLPGNRPIDSANLQVLGTISEMGDRRPIVASNIQVRDIISVSGDRPIAASSIQISETQMIMGNRPIASNYIDLDEDLMGYLD